MVAVLIAIRYAHVPAAMTHRKCRLIGNTLLDVKIKPLGLLSELIAWRFFSAFGMLAEVAGHIVTAAHVANTPSSNL